MPSHSFDFDVMTAIFAAYPKEIRDITKDSALVLNLDQNIDAFFEPFDLLRYNTISVNFVLLNKLDEKQMEQEAFINLPIVVKVLLATLTCFGVYQAMSSELQAFIYFQF